MARKSKQAGGNLPLTHYERTKKFASSEYGTTRKHLSGHSQYQLGDCALSLAPLGDSALVTPSGYLYAKDAILEYLLTQTQLLKEQQAAFERQQLELQSQSLVEDDRKRAAQSDLFATAQSVIKKQKTVDEREKKLQDLKRTSYWLADSQTVAATSEPLEKPPDRPLSPY